MTTTTEIMALADAYARADHISAVRQYRATLQTAVEALVRDAEFLTNLLKTIKSDRHDWEDWPADSFNAMACAIAAQEVNHG